MQYELNKDREREKKIDLSA